MFQLDMHEAAGPCGASLDQFQELCSKHYLSMSEALRSHINSA